METRWLRSLLAIVRSQTFKYVVGLLILAAVGRHVWTVWNDLEPGQYELFSNPLAYVGSVVTYLIGLSVFGLFYGRVLDTAVAPISYGVAVRAYLISHLGKYVPGKALVVLIRASLSARGAISPASAAFATLYETLLMMSAGAFLAAIGFLAFPVVPLYGVIAFALGVAFLVTVSPAVFPRICRLAKTPFKGVGTEAIPRVTWRLLLEGLLSASMGWVLLGASLVWILEGLSDKILTLPEWSAVVAGVAFATVAGFAVAVLPGGLGIREGVLIVTLTPSFGVQLATISALLLRLSWVAGESLVTLALLPLTGNRRSD